ncbi:MAG: HisA/HisF-related TIM barrel protein [Planctomycetota bacterium]
MTNREPETRRDIASLDQLIGVIDLCNAQCVHAVAGNRSEYRPLELTSGNPSGLLNAYARVGIRDVYIADIDALTRQEPQVELLRQLVRVADGLGQMVWLDAGWNPKLSRETVRRIDHENLHWIAATESMLDPSDIEGLWSIVDSGRVALSLDLHDGRLKCGCTGETNLAAWLEIAAKRACKNVIVLDTAFVGTGKAPGPPKHIKEIIEWLDQNAQEPLVISGGGLSQIEDKHFWLSAGVDRVLVATALHRRMRETGDFIIQSCPTPMNDSAGD